MARPSCTDTLRASLASCILCLAHCSSGAEKMTRLRMDEIRPTPSAARAPTNSRACLLTVVRTLTTETEPMPTPSHPLAPRFYREEEATAKETAPYLRVWIRLVRRWEEGEAPGRGYGAAASLEADAGMYRCKRRRRRTRNTSTEALLFHFEARRRGAHRGVEGGYRALRTKESAEGDAEVGGAAGGAGVCCAACAESEYTWRDTRCVLASSPSQRSPPALVTRETKHANEHEDEADLDSGILHFLLFTDRFLVASRRSTHFIALLPKVTMHPPSPNLRCSLSSLSCAGFDNFPMANMGDGSFSIFHHLLSIATRSILHKDDEADLDGGMYAHPAPRGSKGRSRSSGRSSGSRSGVGGRRIRVAALKSKRFKRSKKSKLSATSSTLASLSPPPSPGFPQSTTYFKLAPAPSGEAEGLGAFTQAEEFDGTPGRFGVPPPFEREEEFDGAPGGLDFFDDAPVQREALPSPGLGRSRGFSASGRRDNAFLVGDGRGARGVGEWICVWRGMEAAGVIFGQCRVFISTDAADSRDGWANGLILPQEVAKEELYSASTFGPRSFRSGHLKLSVHVLAPLCAGVRTSFLGRRIPRPARLGYTYSREEPPLRYGAYLSSSTTILFKLLV
ncbi:hypothetical protein C8R43DRAFT_1111073 [Mycena crocata]|nr:hypothetical protein C8R43DRAFT_1111073 [Mycena crocata]